MTILEAEKRDVWLAMKRGFLGHCPHCGEGRIFSSYLKVNPTCPHCGEELHHHRADDAPPYITIFIVGHIVVGLMLAAEQVYDDSPIWLNVLVWPLLSVILSLAILPRVKGALIAYQWALRMHGFDKADQIP
ncbi:DUF983 domain-containing protein [Methylovirgula sp. 4M-Z18]|nr:DUF983 domain-containing protein [Methylovirgula sp. 4M-Z18]